MKIVWYSIALATYCSSSIAMQNQQQLAKPSVWKIILFGAPQTNENTNPLLGLAKALCKDCSKNIQLKKEKIIKAIQKNKK